MSPLARRLLCRGALVALALLLAGPAEAQRQRGRAAANGRQPNVLILTIPSSIPGGAATVPDRLRRGLEKRGAHVRTVSHWWDLGFEPGIRYTVSGNGKSRTFFRSRTPGGKKLARVTRWRTLRAGGRTRRLPSAMKALVSADERAQAGRELVDQVVARLEADGFVPDVIHVHTHTFAHDGTLDEIVRRTGDPPVVFTIHQPITAPKTARGAAQRTTAEAADRLVTISRGWSATSRKLYGKDVRVVHNATDYFGYRADRAVARRAEELARELAPRGEKIVLYSGRLEKLKVQGLAEAFSRVADRWNANLVIVGSAGGEAAEKKLVEWGLDPRHLSRVKFAGWIDGTSEPGRRELAAYYRMLTPDKGPPRGALVMPVRTKNHYGLSVLDAVAMKAPVISGPGNLSTYETTPDAASLTDAMERSFSRPAEVRERIDRTYRRARRGYSVDGYLARRHLEIYREAIDSHRPRAGRTLPGAAELPGSLRPLVTPYDE